MTIGRSRTGVRGLFRLRLRSVARINADSDDELAAFLDSRIDDLTAHGMNPGDARAEAVRRLGGDGLEDARISLRRSSARRERRLYVREWLQDMRSDLRISIRMLWRERGYSAVVAFTLSLGIGTAAATFAAVNHILLRPLPVRDQEHLALLMVQNTALLDPHVGVTYGILSDLRARSHAIESAAGVPAALAAAPFAMRDGDRVVQLALTATTGNFFQVLGALPQHGRLLEASDDAGTNGPAAVLSYAAWQSVFGGRPDIVGHQIALSSGTFAVVGIAPRGFDYPRGTEMWVSDLEYLRLAGYNAGPQDGYWDVLIRLKTNETMAEASRELMSEVRGSTAPLLGQQGTRVESAESFTDVIVGNQRNMLELFAAAVALVLIVACINVAGLILARGLSQAREIAVRKALGASARRIVRQLMAENLMLSVLGGALGVVVAQLLLSLLVVLAPPDLARMDEVRIDPVVVGFAIGLTIMTAVAFGLAPAVSAARVKLSTSLRQEGRAQTGSMRTVRIRQLLVMSQVALAIVMLTSAGLLLRNLARLQRLDLGFNTNNLLFVFAAQLDNANGSDFKAATARHTAVILGLVERLKATPGVTGATSTEAIPFAVLAGTGGLDVHYGLEGTSIASGVTSPKAGFNIASDDYFATLGIPLMRGRAFTTSDRTGNEQVAIVSESFARRAWPDADALGRKVRFLNEGAVGLWRTVVGVAADTRYHDFLTVRPEVYIPLYQTEPGTFVVIRTAGDPRRMVPLVRDAVRGLDQGYGIAKTVSSGELLDARLARPRFLAAIVTALALAAAMLAAVGLFGVLSFSIKQRRHELGIRVALGATARQLQALVLRDVARMSAAGIVLGLAVGIPAARIVRHEIGGLSTFDPPSLAAALGLLVSTVLVASALPLARATRVDPVAAMRE